MGKSPNKIYNYKINYNIFLKKSQIYQSCVYLTSKKNLIGFFFAFTHTIFLSNYSLSFLLFFATLIEVSQILLDLCFLQKLLSNKSRTLLSLSLHYLPSDFIYLFFLFLLISHSILQIFYSPIVRIV